ncbi:MAG TPA: hypothetical protein VFY40_09075 [Blastocatellia bacterium]|nr:hypothetical protein [Blastocatellia bacterium]
MEYELWKRFILPPDRLLLSGGVGSSFRGFGAFFLFGVLPGLA